LTNKVNEVINEANSDDAIIQALKDYRDDLDAHEAKEECTLVHLWLNLSEDQYKIYRSYLTWQYAMMY